MRENKKALHVLIGNNHHDRLEIKSKNAEECTL